DRRKTARDTAAIGVGDERRRATRTADGRRDGIGQRAAGSLREAGVAAEDCSGTANGSTATIRRHEGTRLAAVARIGAYGERIPAPCGLRTRVGVSAQAADDRKRAHTREAAAVGRGRKFCETAVSGGRGDRRLLCGGNGRRESKGDGSGGTEKHLLEHHS